MSGEAAFHSRLRAMVTEPGARGLMDDAALFPTEGEQLVLTSDTMVEGVHYRPDDPPETVGWKLAAVNLSDLAAKGAFPRACLLNHALTGQPKWDEGFLDGLGRAMKSYGMPLIGGDTVALPPGTPRVSSLTAIGSVPSGQRVPGRNGARPGDRLYVTGPVGDSGAGLALLAEGKAEPPELVRAYRVPVPHLAIGQTQGPEAHAMMDVSDGLLIDAARLAATSGVGIQIVDIPLSPQFVALHGDSVEARLRAATSGDDYVLLVVLPNDRVTPAGLIPIGHCRQGEGLALRLDGRAVPLPARLGYEHGAG